MADSPEEKNNIDLDKILLPKKEASVDSAQRVQAGALMQQEKDATLPKVEKPAPVTPPPPKNEDEIKPLQTFQGDIEKVVQNKNVSLVSVAAAEANRRAEQPLTPPTQTTPNSGAWKRIAMIVLGTTLIVSALGIFGYFFIKISPSPSSTPEAQTPYVTVDMTQDLLLEPLDVNRRGLMEGLVAARDTLQISLGLVTRVRVGVASTTADAREYDTQEFLTTLAPNIPEQLTHTLDRTFILGLYSYAGNQPFLLVKTDSYERAFASMLEWEKYMRNDLLPLFDQKPPVENTTASSSSSTTPPIPIPTDFVDRVIENHDTRVIQNERHEVLFLWTFLDRKTLLITTTPDVVKEVIRRLKDAPIV
ncbi:hypothetical protein KW798_03320, partial [Candidatus Parcubacteria bacterium]|nr:hypothetical protein [Candidatus Parcubacteria bacterium]